jgi:uncharacterized SAM-binding protein YcdF (DUF218 family)
VLLVAAFIAASLALFVFPHQDHPQHAAAVVVLSGSRVGRLPTGLRLVEKGVAPVLVISGAPDPRWPEANRLCASPRQPGFRVICFHPDPDDTRGEAEHVAALARQNGWGSLAVVSSTYHLFRAHKLFKRCFAGPVAMVGWSPGLVRWIEGVPEEWVKLGAALTVRRAC